MMNFPESVKEKLTELISNMAANPELFIKNPETDFTRTRKLSFETVMHLILSMGGNSLSNEIMKYFDYNANAASSSAFIQQRDKISPFAFEYILDKFTNFFQDLKT